MSEEAKARQGTGQFMLQALAFYSPCVWKPVTGSEEKHDMISLSIFQSIVWGLLSQSKYLHRNIIHNVLFSFSSSHEYTAAFLKAAQRIMVNRLKAEADRSIHLYSVK